MTARWAEVPAVSEVPSASASCQTFLGIFFALVSHPPVPEKPSYDGGEAAPADDSIRTHTLEKDAGEADNEADNGADVLYYDGRIGHEGPEFVRLYARVAL